MVAPHFVMTWPSAFEVTYAINPWMDPKRWHQNADELRGSAALCWQKLNDRLRAAGARVHMLDPVPGLPDLVFPANGAVVLDSRALLGRFANPERQREEPVFLRFFEGLLHQGVVKELGRLPENLIQEGAGDCLWDACRGIFWAGHGPRSSSGSAAVVADFFSCEVQPLGLVDPRFYHLDLAFCVLEGGEILYCPAAFDPVSLGLIRERVPLDRRLEMGVDEALRFSLNALCFNGAVFTTDPAHH